MNKNFKMLAAAGTMTILGFTAGNMIAGRETEKMETALRATEGRLYETEAQLAETEAERNRLQEELDSTNTLLSDIEAENSVLRNKGDKKSGGCSTIEWIVAPPACVIAGRL